MISWSTLSLTFKDNCSYWIRVSKFLFGDPRCRLHNNPQHFSGKTKKIQVYSETGVIFRRENESPRAEQAQMCRRGVDMGGQPLSSHTWSTSASLSQEAFIGRRQGRGGIHEISFHNIEKMLDCHYLILLNNAYSQLQLVQTIDWFSQTIGLGSIFFLLQRHLVVNIRIASSLNYWSCYMFRDFRCPLWALLIYALIGFKYWIPV